MDSGSYPAGFISGGQIRLYTNSLTNTLPADMFAGYTYRVVGLPGGLQALQLSINMIPEPSTILLLVGGGLVSGEGTAKERLAGGQCTF